MISSCPVVTGRSVFYGIGVVWFVYILNKVRQFFENMAVCIIFEDLIVIRLKRNNFCSKEFK